MKATGLLLGVLTCVTVSGVAAANDYAPDAVVVARGEYAITLEDLDARMHRFPAHERAQFVRDPGNMVRLLDKLLVDQILAAEAKELGIDKDPAVRRDIELAVREVLSTHRLKRFFEADIPDFSTIARERYLADPAAYAIPAQITVEHVLVSTQTRSDDEARKIAQTVRARATQSPEEFAALVEQYSEDPSKQDNRGRFVIDDPSIYDPAFMQAAQGLSRPGDVSEPVLSSFGYHVIRLVERRDAQPQSFEQVEESLVRRVERDYRDTVRVDYLAEIRSRYPETGNEDLLRSLPARYGGRPEEVGSAD